MRFYAVLAAIGFKIRTGFIERSSNFFGQTASVWHVLELKPIVFGPIPIEFELWNRLNQPEIARHRTGLMTGFLRETNFKMLEMGELKVTPAATKIFA